MNRLFISIAPVVRWAVSKSWATIFAALLLAGTGAWLASNLRIDTDFSKLIPADYESVKALEKLRDTVGSESESAVAIVSSSFEANRTFAEDLIPRVLELQDAEGQPLVTRVEYRRDTEFLENNALYFATPEELQRVNTRLSERIEDAKLEANPFYFDLDDEEEDDGTSEEESLDEVYQRIVGKEYPVSDDSTTLVVQFYPAGSQTNIGFIEDLYAKLDTTIASLQPTSYDASMEVVVAGRLLRQLVEVDAIRNDILGSFGVGMLCVLLLVTSYFAYKSYTAQVGHRLVISALLSVVLRIPVMALIIGLPLVMSLCWTFGTAYLVIGSLNLMTATLGLVLFGLGIDYGIHFYARYSEERALGKSQIDAVETTFVSTGQAITVGALTTAAALYALMIADFKGFSEFGFIAGTGILFAVVAMLLVMPALISVFERLKLLNMEASLAVSERPALTRFRGSKAILAGSVLLVVAAFAFFPPQFEYQFGELEPEYAEYNAKRDIIRRVYNGGSKRNPAYVVLDSSEEAEQVVAALYQKMQSDTLSPTIASVENLQERFPLQEVAQERRLEAIAEIRGRLEDPILQAEGSADLDRLSRAASTTEAIGLEQIPSFLRDQFTAKDGSIGNFVIIYPSVGLSDGRMSIAFSEDVGSIETEDGRIYHAGSTSLVAADMLKLMRSEAPWMVLITFLVVIVLMWINFGSLRWGLLALAPLIVGVLWMILFMEIFDLKFNFYNLIVLPAILGIGNDAGVHLVHRYREEGPGSIKKVLRSTGEHITMGSLTTMIGFAGPLLSFHPGLNTIGSLAVVGIATTLVATLVFLPALIQTLETAGKMPGTRVH